MSPKSTPHKVDAYRHHVESLTGGLGEAFEHVGVERREVPYEVVAHLHWTVGKPVDFFQFEAIALAFRPEGAGDHSPAPAAEVGC